MFIKLYYDFNIIISHTLTFFSYRNVNYAIKKQSVVNIEFINLKMSSCIDLFVTLIYALQENDAYDKIIHA